MADPSVDTTLAELWDHLHPEPKMDGASVVTRNRIPAELVGRVHAALASRGSSPETQYVIDRRTGRRGEPLASPSAPQQDELREAVRSLVTISQAIRRPGLSREERAIIAHRAFRAWRAIDALASSSPAGTDATSSVATEPSRSDTKENTT